ncbi:DUF1788 domain-containing protein [Methanoplanus endosymbiosus]|uniref:DUF1788 domain-containing protein n=1 Tax=Methanoplanus endosymbiosus TaxID=33865 RepID=A0A9E7PMA6_9EURY|nr:DUF1788 domain-containing protein [Methanoplanus endosymbiosus]UUX92485.1 DUF1788 domain-containing protein [Methanoplanus endosymbiosus]
MTKLQNLSKRYKEHVELVWQRNISGPEKVWFCIYDPNSERKIRAGIKEFEIYTIQSGHKWTEIDLSPFFEEWLSENEYREEYFSEPEYLLDDLSELKEFLVEKIRGKTSDSDEDTVIAVLGIASMFGILRASQIVELIIDKVKISGRLLVFFPGERDKNNYRLLKARDGWNYLAYPIEAEED